MDAKDNFYTDPSQNFIIRYPQPLDAIFLPQSIAVIGAKDDLGSVGRTIMLNLLSGKLHHRIYPVNPKRDSVLDRKAYPDILSVPEKLTLQSLSHPLKQFLILSNSVFKLG